jgi:hypothetical protein
MVNASAARWDAIPDLRWSEFRGARVEERVLVGCAGCGTMFKHARPEPTEPECSTCRSLRETFAATCAVAEAIAWRERRALRASLSRLCAATDACIRLMRTDDPGYCGLSDWDYHRVIPGVPMAVMRAVCLCRSTVDDGRFALIADTIGKRPVGEEDYLLHAIATARIVWRERERRRAAVPALPRGPRLVRYGSSGRLSVEALGAPSQGCSREPWSWTVQPSGRTRR